MRPPQPSTIDDASQYVSVWLRMLLNTIVSASRLALAHLLTDTVSDFDGHLKRFSLLLPVVHDLARCASLTMLLQQILHSTQTSCRAVRRVSRTGGSGWAQRGLRMEAVPGEMRPNSFNTNSLLSFSTASAEPATDSAALDFKTEVQYSKILTPTYYQGTNEIKRGGGKIRRTCFA